MAGPHWTERESATRQKYQSFGRDEESLYAQGNKKQLVLNTSWIEGEADVSLEGRDEIPKSFMTTTCPAGLPDMYQMQQCASERLLMEQIVVMVLPIPGKMFDLINFCLGVF